MNNNMQYNFNFLEMRVLNSLEKTDLEFIRSELHKITDPTIFSGVGGSSVVSEFGARVLEQKNQIITKNSEPRDFAYSPFAGFKNVVSCSYSGNNYGVELSFCNNLKHYLLSNNRFDEEDVTYLKYETYFEKERSFISLAATLIPISILLNYYLNGDNKQLCQFIKDFDYYFDTNADAYEIFTGIDTSTTSKYLESTFVEAGIGIPIVHDKYAYCHGRSTLSMSYNNIAIYLYRGTELDNLLLEELKKYYKDIVVLQSNHSDSIIDDYQMLWQAMHLTKYIASKKNKDLSLVEYCPIVKKLYRYNKQV